MHHNDNAHPLHQRAMRSHHQQSPTSHQLNGGHSLGTSSDLHTAEADGGHENVDSFDYAENSRRNYSNTTCDLSDGVLDTTTPSIASSATTIKKTFYEEFKETFPSLVRENSATATRQSAALGALRQFDGHLSAASQFADVSQTLHYEEQCERRSDLINQENMILNELNAVREQINALLVTQHALELQLADVRDQQSDISDTIEILADKINSSDSDELMSSAHGDQPSLYTLSAEHRSKNFTNDSCLKTLNGTHPITCLDFAAPHDLLATGSSDTAISLWDLGRWRHVRQIRVGSVGAVRCLQYDGSLLISGGDDKRISVLRIPSLSTGTLLSMYETATDDELVACHLNGHYGPILCLKFDSSQLITGSADNTVRLWDVAAQVCTSTLHLGYSHDDNNTSLGATADNRKGLASVSSLNNNNNNKNNNNILHKGVGALQFYRHALATGSSDGVIRLWDTRQKHGHSAAVRSLNGHTRSISSLQFHDSQLISASADKSIRVWDLRMGLTVEGLITSSNDGVHQVQFDAHKIVAAAGDNNITVFNRKSMEQTKLSGHTAPVKCIKFVDERLISAGDDSVIKIWDIAHGWK